MIQIKVTWFHCIEPWLIICCCSAGGLYIMYTSTSNWTYVLCIPYVTFFPWNRKVMTTRWQMVPVPRPHYLSANKMLITLQIAHVCLIFYWCWHDPHTYSLYVNFCGINEDGCLCCNTIYLWIYAQVSK